MARTKEQIEAGKIMENFRRTVRETEKFFEHAGITNEGSRNLGFVMCGVFEALKAKGGLLGICKKFGFGFNHVCNNLHKLEVDGFVKSYYVVGRKARNMYRLTCKGRAYAFENRQYNQTCYECARWSSVHSEPIIN